MTDVPGVSTEPHPPSPPDGTGTPITHHEGVGPAEPVAPIIADPLHDPVADMGANPRRRAQPLIAVLLALCLVLLLSGAYLLWESRQDESGAAARLNTLEQRLSAIEPRLKSLEARPLPPPAPDVRPLDQRMAALEAKAGTPDPARAALEQKVAALEAKFAAPDPARTALEDKVAALDQREAAFEQKPPAQATLDAASRTEIAALAGRVDQVVARQTQLGEAAQADAAKMADRITAQDQRVAAATKTAAQLDQVTNRAASLAAIQAASGALAAGRPLGPMPGANPALAQFAMAAPPTEASLRLSYPAAADAARTAGLPPKTDGAFLDRIWARAQSSVTVRQGDRVLVGDPIAGVLAHAEQQVDAGDLAGAIQTLDGLSGPAATAMADWRKQAQSLLDARAALLTMARG